MNFICSIIPEWMKTLLRSEVRLWEAPDSINHWVESLDRGGVNATFVVDWTLLHFPWFHKIGTLHTVNFDCNGCWSFDRHSYFHGYCAHIPRQNYWNDYHDITSLIIVWLIGISSIIPRNVIFYACCYRMNYIICSCHQVRCCGLISLHWGSYETRRSCSSSKKGNVL